MVAGSPSITDHGCCRRLGNMWRNRLWRGNRVGRRAAGRNSSGTRWSRRPGRPTYPSRESTWSVPGFGPGQVHGLCPGVWNALVFFARRFRFAVVERNDATGFLHRRRGLGHRRVQPGELHNSARRQFGSRLPTTRGCRQGKSNDRHCAQRPGNTSLAARPLDSAPLSCPPYEHSRDGSGCWLRARPPVIAVRPLILR